MVDASKEDLIALFEEIHGKMTGTCYAEVVLNEDWDPVAVACMKGGQVAWQATLAEMAIDLFVLDRRQRAPVDDHDDL